MSVTNKVSLTLAYKGTSYTRNYEFDVAQSALANVKSKVLAYNANVPAADKLVFISNDYDDSDPENIIGTFENIKSAKVITETTTKIPLF